jgi:hypothetical protein
VNFENGHRKGYVGGPTKKSSKKCKTIPIEEQTKPSINGILKKVKINAKTNENTKRAMIL